MIQILNRSHKFRINLFGLILIIALGVTPNAVAQQGGFDVGFDVGGMAQDDNLGAETVFRSSIRLGYFLTDAFEIEAQSIATNRAKLNGEILWETNIEELSFSGQMLNGVFHFRVKESFVPFVMAGVGQVKAKVKGTEEISLDNSETAIQLGLGARLYLGKSRRGSIRFELSTLHHDLRTIDEDSTQISFSTGFCWRFRG